MHLFGEEASKSILIDFLNDLLEGEREVKVIKYLKTETLPEFAFGRGVIFDVLCTGNTGEQFSDRMRMIFLQLPLFCKEEEAGETNLDKWFYILTRMDTLERMPWKAQKAAFEKLMERAETANFTPEEQARYEAQLDAYRVMNSAMEKSKEEGKEEGKQEGRKEGIREGEKKKAIEIALALKQRGLDTTSIAEISGLSVTEIENL